jgi:hypothetical protein
MTSDELKNICIDAINAALVSRGKKKGMLKAKCPPMGSDAAAAWQALMGYANPYKLGMGHIMFFTDRQSAIYRAIDDAIKGQDVRALDRDRVALEIMGAW